VEWVGRDRQEVDRPLRAEAQQAAAAAIRPKSATLTVPSARICILSASFPSAASVMLSVAPLTDTESRRP